VRFDRSTTRSKSIKFIACTFESNVARSFGGAVFVAGRSNTEVEFTRCRFISNTSKVSGSSTQCCIHHILFIHSLNCRSRARHQRTWQLFTFAYAHTIPVSHLSHAYLETLHCIHYRTIMVERFPFKQWDE
jgi:predicted outer membrane repeat protein